VAYYGVPVILDVPGIGFVEVSEDEYAQLYKQLSSSGQEQVNAAIASLRAIKAAEDAEIEAAQNAPRSTPGHFERDLSEPNLVWSAIASDRAISTLMQEPLPSAETCGVPGGSDADLLSLFCAGRGGIFIWHSS
jgi:hypothetical protein